MKIKYLPNLLSSLRIILVPFFAHLFMSGRTKSAVVVFLLSGLTDVLDGFIARKFNCISSLGKILDPLADKLTQLTAFVCLYFSELVPVWMPIVYFVKELGTTVGAFLVLKNRRVVVKSNVFGKLATLFVFVFVCVDIVFGKAIPKRVIGAVCTAICIYFVFSCIMYIKTEALPVTAEKTTERAKS